MSLKEGVAFFAALNSLEEEQNKNGVLTERARHFASLEWKEKKGGKKEWKELDCRRTWNVSGVLVGDVPRNQRYRVNQHKTEKQQNMDDTVYCAALTAWQSASLSTQGTR